MPAVERQLGGQLVLGEHLAHDPICLAGGVFGRGIEEHAGSVRRPRDVVPEPTAHAVLHLVLAERLNRATDVGRIAERDGYPPVICHNDDLTAPRRGWRALPAARGEPATRCLEGRFAQRVSLPVRRSAGVSGCPEVTVSSRRSPADRARNRLLSAYLSGHGSVINGNALS